VSVTRFTRPSSAVGNPQLTSLPPSWYPSRSVNGSLAGQQGTAGGTTWTRPPPPSYWSSATATSNHREGAQPTGGRSSSVRPSGSESPGSRIDAAILVPRKVVPNRGTGTKRDEARYDSGARIGGYRNGKAKVKPRACIGAARCRCPPPAAAATPRCRTV
jgi:hypothetical protein